MTNRGLQAKDRNGCVRRQPYLDMNVKLQRALTPADRFDLDSALKQARTEGFGSVICFMTTCV